MKDGSNDFRHDALLYELKGSFKAENILDKTGSLKTSTTQISKLVPKAVPIQDSKTIAKNVDKELDTILKGEAMQE